MCLGMLQDSNAKPDTTHKPCNNNGPKQHKGKKKANKKSKGTKKKNTKCERFVKCDEVTKCVEVTKCEEVTKCVEVTKCDEVTKCVEVTKCEISKKLYFREMLVEYKMQITKHAYERALERGIDIDRLIYYKNILKMPIYTTDNGCTKYLDVKNQIVYYVRNRTIETMISTNPIQMLRYYAFGKGMDINKLCRDHACNNCKRSNCKYIHVNFE